MLFVLCIVNIVYNLENKDETLLTIKYNLNCYINLHFEFSVQRCFVEATLYKKKDFNIIISHYQVNFLYSTD